jgi:DNA-binding transcriptional ArsR family regulator
MDKNYQQAELKAEVLKALAHPTRLMIVERLAKGERCVCELNELFEADHSTISKHLAILKQSGLVSDRKDGLKVYYRLECPCIIEFINCVSSVIATRAQKDLSAIKKQQANVR